jgi:uncharacterized protein YodC (DUF2158 family)
MVGDVVRLNSDGPKMTVINQGTDTGGTPYVSCAWFGKEGKPEEYSFPPDALTLVVGKDEGR